jgi:tetratricopeptide (TPR) repeat protein
MSPEAVRKAANLMHVDAIVWVDVKQLTGRWEMGLTIVAPAKNRFQSQAAVAVTNWNKAISTAASRISLELGTAATAQWELLNGDLSRSGEALEWFSRAYATTAITKDVPTAVADLRRSLEFDPNFSMAQGSLAYYLPLLGSVDEAVKIAEAAVRQHPADGRVRFCAGVAYLFGSLFDLARGEFLQAISARPDLAPAYTRLAESYSQQQRWGEAIDVLNRAETKAPFDPWIHAALGYAYAQTDQRGPAAAELAQALDADASSAPAITLNIANAYELLNDTANAAKSYEKYIAEAERTGTSQKLLEPQRAKLKELQNRLTTCLVAGGAPPFLSTSDLTAEISQRLAGTPAVPLVYPFAGSHEITNWARQVIGSTTEDEAKARLLFDALCRSATKRESRSRRTATQTLKAMSAGDTDISCQDYTFLYMALARAVGLNAFYVLVDKDYSGEVVSHACVGFPAGNMALLADVSYRWFGVAHKSYEFEDDIRVVAAYMAQSGNTQDEQTALRLCSGWAVPHFWVAIMRMERNQPEEARAALKVGLKLDSTTWLSSYAQALMADYDQNWDGMITELHRCLRLNPEWSRARYYLAGALAKTGDFKGARAEYSAFLATEADAELAVRAREMIKAIEANLRTDEDGK